MAPHQRPLAAGLLGVLGLAIAFSPRPAAALTLVTSATKATMTIEKAKAGKDKFGLQTAFQPAGLPAPDLRAVPVTIAIGTFAQTIPVGAFVAKSSRRATTWTFKGAVGGLKSVKVTRTADVWRLKATGSGVTLAGTASPVTVAVDIGADHGVQALFFTVKDGAKKTTFKYPPGKTDDADRDGSTVKGGDCNDQDPASLPGAPERCNGADDDCDGTIDEGFALGAACAAGIGACRRDGLTICAVDGTIGCGALLGIPGTELCGNGRDDDCDGSTDEGFALSAPCSVGSGLCRRDGFTVCGPDATGTVCEAAPAPGCVVPPAIGIVEPANLSLFNRARIAVSGTVGNEVVQVVCNEYAAAIQSGGFGVTLTLDEGNDVVSCVARDAAGNTRTASTSVTVDTQAPRVTITAPADGATVATAAVTVTGLINDVVVGTINQQEAAVVCNGVTAQIANRSFVASAVPLTPGANTITCGGTDRAGNADSDRVNVTLAVPSGPALRLVSGDGQTGVVGSALAVPLVVALLDGGVPLAGKAVLFAVRNNDGTLESGTLGGQRVAVVTDAAGRAQASFTLGTWAGAGSNQVLATAPGYGGEVLFSTTATPGAAATVVVDSGANQEGGVDERLPLPFVVAVVDGTGNRLAGVPVTFGVVQGGGNLGGQQIQTMSTDGDGRAQVVLTLGPEEGFDNNVVTATFTGNAGSSAAFTASAKLPGKSAETKISGVILDNTNQPIAGVTVGVEDETSLTNPKALLSSTVSDAQGQFVLQPVPVGHVVLRVDGATAARPGTWPRLEFDMVTIAGRNNTVGMPIYLLPIDVANGLAVDDTHGGTITLPEVPGFALTVLPASVTFLDGTTRGTVSVTAVHPDKVPMVPNFGQQPRFVVTIQPAGVHFNPPAALTIPNADGLAPGQKTEMYSFDHDLGQFVSIGPGTVSADGALVVSDPGVGVIKGGWHAAGRPISASDVVNCDDRNPCTIDLVQEVCAGTSCTGRFTCTHPPALSGTPCDQPFAGAGGVGCGDDFIEVAIDRSCGGETGQCEAGFCKNGPFSAAEIFRNAAEAITKVCTTGCIGDPLRSVMKNCLRFKGLKIDCDADGSGCAQAGISQFISGCGGGVFCANEITLFPLVYDKGECGALESTVLHEMVHSHGCDFGNLLSHNDGLTEDNRDDSVYGCEESCYPSAKALKADPSLCH